MFVWSMEEIKDEGSVMDTASEMEDVKLISFVELFPLQLSRYSLAL